MSKARGKSSPSSDRYSSTKRESYKPKCTAVGHSCLDSSLVKAIGQIYAQDGVKTKKVTGTVLNSISNEKIRANLNASFARTVGSIYAQDIIETKKAAETVINSKDKEKLQVMYKSLLSANK